MLHDCTTTKWDCTPQTSYCKRQKALLSCLAWGLIIMFSYFLHFEPWNEWPSRIDGGQIQIQPLMVRSPCSLLTSHATSGYIQTIDSFIQRFAEYYVYISLTAIQSTILWVNSNYIPMLFVPIQSTCGFYPIGQSYRRVALRAGPQWPSWWGWWTRKTKDSSWISSSPWRFSSCNHQKQRGISPLKSNECLVVDLPLWKIRFRQLGFSYSQYMENTNCSKPPTRIWCWFNQHWGIKRNFSKTNWAKIGFHTQQWGVGLGFDSKNSWNTLKCAIQLMSTLTGATPWDVLGSPPVPCCFWFEDMPSCFSNSPIARVDQLRLLSMSRNVSLLPIWCRKRVQWAHLGSNFELSWKLKG